MRGGAVAEALGRQRDPGERRPQVPLDVVGEGLERGDVQDADGARAPPRGRPAAGARPAGRGTTGTRPGSCRCPSGRGSACAGRRRWPPSPAPGRAWAPRSSPRTRRGRRARRARADRRWARPRDREYRSAATIWYRCSFHDAGHRQREAPAWLRHGQPTMPCVRATLTTEGATPHTDAAPRGGMGTAPFPAVQSRDVSSAGCWWPNTHLNAGWPGCRPDRPDTTHLTAGWPGSSAGSPGYHAPHGWVAGIVGLRLRVRGPAAPVRR